MKIIIQEPGILPNEAQKRQINRQYGLFIHFGINTFNEVEWSDGTLPINSYKPTCIDAEQWVRTAYEAGMTYIILVAKHHDGFCLWKTKYSKYSIDYSDSKVDVIKEVSKACQKYGIELGIYYSLWDRNVKIYADDERYVEYMVKQLAELLDGRYGEIAELWLDGGWDKSSSRWGLDQIYNLMKNLQPYCVMGVNHTIGEYDSQGMAKERYLPINYKECDEMKFFPSDFRLWDPNFTREGKDNDPKIYMHKGQQYYLPFEATICIRNMTNWFWDSQYTKESTVSPAFIVEKYRHMLEQNNLLIVNCGPNTKGKIEEYDRQTLYEAGRMLGIARGSAIID